MTEKKLASTYKKLHTYKHIRLYICNLVLPSDMLIQFQYHRRTLIQPHRKSTTCMSWMKECSKPCLTSTCSSHESKPSFLANNLHRGINGALVLDSFARRHHHTSSDRVNGVRHQLRCHSYRWTHRQTVTWCHVHTITIHSAASLLQQVSGWCSKMYLPITSDARPSCHN